MISNSDNELNNSSISECQYETDTTNNKSNKPLNGTKLDFKKRKRLQFLRRQASFDVLSLSSLESKNQDKMLTKDR